MIPCDICGGEYNVSPGISDSPAVLHSRESDCIEVLGQKVKALEGKTNAAAPNIVDMKSPLENSVKSSMLNYMRDTPIPDSEILSSIPLFMGRQDLSHVLFLNEVYQKILDVHGVIMEFGVRWGRNMVTLHNLRSTYEPYNHNRKIIGFDTFAGFEGGGDEDGEWSKDGMFSVTDGYEDTLTGIMSLHEKNAPNPHIRKSSLHKGDASKTVPEYISQNPHTVIALAYFDMDIYAPTKAVIESIIDRMPKGGVMVFDELNHPDHPGETLALVNSIGISTYKLTRSKFSSFQSYIIL